MPYAKVNGTTLYYETKGNGPTVVLLHGWTLDATMWDGQFDEFAKQYHVLRYDLRGYGKSALKTQEPFTHQDDLKALLDYLKIEQATIIGLSMGGTIAINFTLTYPDSVSTLVTVDSSIENSTSPYMADFNKSWSKIFVKGKEGGVESARSYWMEMPLFKPAMENPRCSTKLKNIVGSYSGWDFVNESNIIEMSPIPERRLYDVKAPTLVVVGELDDPSFLDIGNVISNGIRGSEKVTLRGVGHMSNMENPEGFNRIVLDFLGKSIK